ncbi:NADH-quinone oxidoreductase subunit N [Paenibacillus sp. 1001270B_150601_E10]|uniref:NADH-quinone oxidoreductase subunit N n=1 Tax=Paenibacillus sp. 1001270B_150601_E10 TaxID=2787079 RepID=UPI00189D73C6|nr:NADH-quinone oxidoreductase subunit N [Paenibacillus sp. 1001270B_150601_E10]
MVSTSTTIHTLQWADLAILAPELTLVIAAILITILDLFAPRKWGREWTGALTLISIGISFGFVAWKLADRISLAAAVTPPEVHQLLNHSYRVDDFALWMKLLFLVAAFLVVLMSLRATALSDMLHRSEYYYLILPAVLGAMMLASSGDLITLFIGTELLSITTYILVGMKKSSRGLEGAFKYTVLGGTASAFILYGMSFLYGLSGSTNLNEIGRMLQQNAEAFEPLIYLSFILILVGVGFKIAAAPFHMWAQDVYEASPTPIAAFLAVITKAASLALLFRLVYNSYLGLGYAYGEAASPMFIYKDFTTLILALAAISMVVGTAMALRERRVKRILALSGVANTGYLLVPIGLDLLTGASIYTSSFTSFWYYMAAYLFTVIGAFAVWMIIEKRGGTKEQSALAGLFHRSPWLAAAMILFMLSLAGIPITAGFFGKLYILLGAMATHAVWITIVMMVTSAVSFYIYFGFIRQMYMRGGEAGKVSISWTQHTVVFLCMAGVVGLGLFPNVPMEWLQTLFTIPNDLFTQ